MNKLIRNIDNEIYTKFVAICRYEGKISGDVLNKIMKQYLNKKVKELKKIL